MVAAPAHRRAPRRTRVPLVMLLVVLCLLASVTVAGLAGEHRSGGGSSDRRPSAVAAPVPPAYAPVTPSRWERVLADLDRSRARAFAAGDAAALTEVYVRGSTVLRRDRAVLAAYARRGLTVRGAGLRLLEVRVGAASAGRVVLRVVDRLGPARVRRGAERWSRSLPRDHPTLHRLGLVRTAAGWRIAQVRSLSG